MRTPPAAPPAGGSARYRRWAWPLLVSLGLALLLAGWVGGNPPGAAPDEPSHYVKSLVTAYGDGAGTHTAVSPGDDLRARFDKEFGRSYLLPAQYAVPPDWGCTKFQTTAARCLLAPSPAPPAGPTTVVETHVGTYPPALYLPLGLAGRLGGGGLASLLAERAAAATISLLLLAAAAALVAPGWGRVGLLLATTPMVLFLAAAVNTSGIEVAAALAHGTAMLALVRGRRDAPVWLTWALGGAVLALCRPLGPLWIVLATLALAALVGVRPACHRVRTDRRATAAVAVLAAAAVATAAWDALVVPVLPVPLHTVLAGLHPSVALLPRVADQTVGVFGWADTSLPGVVIATVEVLAGVVGALALAVGRWRERVVLAGLAVADLALVLVLNADQERPIGYQVQGRYLLPLTVLVLLVAGHVLHAHWGAHAARRVNRVVFLAVGLGFAGLQGYGWWVNARRYAVGAGGPRLFPPAASWTPVGGWWVWVALAAAGTVLLAVAGVEQLRTPPGEGRPAPVVIGTLHG